MFKNFSFVNESVNDYSIKTIMSAITSELSWTVVDSELIDVTKSKLVGTEFKDSVKTFGDKTAILLTTRPGSSLTKDIKAVVERHIESKVFKVNAGTNTRGDDSHTYLITFK